MTVLTGDSLVALPTLPADSIESCVSDPPYGLEFMSVAWDTFNDGRKGGERTPNTWGDHGSKEHPRNAMQAAHVRRKKSVAFEEFSYAWACEVFRVLKPGGYLLAFGGTRTYHRLTCAIEDAGFEVRDCLMWLYGSGFPKGKGCLKPGWEPIVLARKPAPAPWLNIDGCRIGTSKAIPASPRQTGNSGYGKFAPEDGTGSGFNPNIDRWRWPANVVLSHEDGCREVGTKRVKASAGGAGGKFGSDAVYAQDPWTQQAERGDRPTYADANGMETITAWECAETCPVRMLDLQTGIRTSGSYSGVRRASKFQNTFGEFNGTTIENGHEGSAGGASRFFYCAKASSAERGAFNDHPTVKPLALMRWLVRLVTPAGGTVIDPFCGSGTTLLAAQREGFEAIGIDSDPHAIEITRRRLADEAGPLFAEAMS